MSAVAYWAVARTEANREGVAAYFLAQQNYPTYLPRVRFTRPRVRVAALFPSYIFVRIEERWRAIESTIGVLRLLRNADQPARLHDSVVDLLRSQEQDGLVTLPAPPRWVHGQQVKIAQGTFSGHIGLYDGQSGLAREKILLDLLGRKVRVEIPTAALAAGAAQL